MKQADNVARELNSVDQWGGWIRPLRPHLGYDARRFVADDHGLLHNEVGAHHMCLR